MVDGAQEKEGVVELHSQVAQEVALMAVYHWH
jgi:hypothetical protein